VTAPGQRREPRGRREGDQGVGGRFTTARAEDPPLRGATSHTQRRGLLRDDPGMFSDLLLAAADAGGLARPLVERDYWMCQISTCLVMDSRRHPESFTSMGGGSFLALAGITQRVSEDVDLTVTHSRGIGSCSSNHAKQMMEECQANVETHLGIPGERRNPDGTKPRGGGNYFRTVYYTYPSVLTDAGGTPQEVRSDKGMRDTAKEHLYAANCIPYMGRVAQSLGMELPDDLAARPLLGTHPLQTLADKLDAVCWREALVPSKGQAMLDGLVARIRDHYDIHHLIRWLRDEAMLTADGFAAAAERAEALEEPLRAKMSLSRPVQARPHNGYHTLRAWTSGTAEYAALSAAHARLREFVYDEMPSYDDVCAAVHSAAGVL